MSTCAPSTFHPHVELRRYGSRDRRHRLDGCDFEAGTFWARRAGASGAVISRARLEKCARTARMPARRVEDRSVTSGQPRDKRWRY